MAFDGTGNFHRLYSWVVDAANGLLVDANRMDQDTNDIASALSNCVTRDGQSAPVSDLPMGGFKLTGLGAGSAPSDAVNFSQVFTSPAFTGVPTAPTPPIGTNTDQLATAKMVTETAFSAALPVQAGNAGKFVTTDGMNASWAAINLHPRSARTANAMLASTDKGALIDITSGTFTQTFDTAANLGSGWYCYIRNSGTGNITIPASDGVTNWVMYPNEARLFLCDGVNFYSVVLQAFKFSSQVSGNWIKPPGYNYFATRLMSGGSGGTGGAGGGSGGGYYFSAASGGGGGAGGSGGASGVGVSNYLPSYLIASTVGYVIGSGGAGGAGGTGGAAATSGSSGNTGSGGNVGAAGGASTFGNSSDIYYLNTGTSPVSTAQSSPGNGGANNGGSNGGGANGNNATAGSLSGSNTYAVSFPAALGSNSSAGSGSPSATTAIGPAGAGGNGGNGTASAFANAIAGAVAGAAPTTLGVAGTNGTKPPKAGTACGGAGGSGGSGSVGCGTTTSAATAAAGNGGAGGDGGDGIIEIVGVI